MVALWTSTRNRLQRGPQRPGVATTSDTTRVDTSLSVFLSQGDGVDSERQGGRLALAGGVEEERHLAFADPSDGPYPSDRGWRVEPRAQGRSPEPVAVDLDAVQGPSALDQQEALATQWAKPVRQAEGPPLQLDDAPRPPIFDRDAKEAARGVGRHIQGTVAAEGYPVQPGAVRLRRRELRVRGEDLEPRGPRGEPQNSRVCAVGHIDRAARIDGDVIAEGVRLRQRHAALGGAGSQIEGLQGGARIASPRGAAQGAQIVGAGPEGPGGLVGENAGDRPRAGCARRDE